jgi:hypothetical protein
MGRTPVNHVKLALTLDMASGFRKHRKETVVFL